MINIAINGFGRIGRHAFKILHKNPSVNIVAINDLTSPTVLAHNLKYDSIYGIYNGSVSSSDKSIIIDDTNIPVFAIKDPKELPWGNLSVDVVLECSGRFTTTESASGHMSAGAKKVIISAPAKDEGITPTFLLGVNADQYKGENIISNASCTTNCVSPVVKALDDAIGISKLMMTTVHSYTAEQSIIDTSPPGLHSADLRRARAGAVNMIPTSTGAAISTTKVITNLAGKFDGLSIRVPTPVVSLSDLTILFKRKTSKEEINEVLTKASRNMPTVLGVTNEQVVSSDFKKDPRSAIVDLSLTNIVDGDLAKVIAWYDNEYGYSCRLAEMALLVGLYK